MRVLAYSDLHLEFGRPLASPAVDFDVLVLAGDISSPGVKAVQWARRAVALSARPAVLVPGNHEYYDTVWQRELEQMRQAAKGSLVHVLSRDSVDLGGVRFLGATLWTDFGLHVGGKSNPGKAMAVAQRHLGDFTSVRSTSDTDHATGTRPLTAEETRQIHLGDLNWLRESLQSPFSGPTVVVTHHAPSRMSLHAQFAEDWLSAAFVSELPAEAFKLPVLWIHGHTHAPFDYRIGTCRVVCNPRGYPNMDLSAPTTFDPNLVVTI